ncbi:ATP-dependent helicase/nuclease subunit B [Humitalea rosea]|uniref:ATP-dependent helicase/nuclease subunit B n=1 Tax=Humitalea rosea TaxID=990373 RepID=A0A2W7IGX1_9PROT|nr:ATP-dependent helicase/nuclease subunit B [Humitalea rosea]
MLREVGDDPLALARATILLPTRRAARALHGAFLQAAGSGAPAMLLPRMRALAGLSVEDAEDLALPGLLALPPAVEPARRLAVLAACVLRLPAHLGGPGTPPQAWAMAAELARLLDEIALEDADPARLASLVPENFATHWQVTLRFLEAVLADWQGWLAGQGLLDIGARRVAALRVQTAAWAADPPQDPVIAAGIGAGGTIPAAVAFLAMVARLPRGEVVLHGAPEPLPALEDAIRAAPTHPLSGQARLLAALGATAGDLRPWPVVVATAPEARARLLGLALRPAEGLALPDWRDRADWGAALAGLSTIAAPDAQAEAVAIALALRETLETPGATAALVTADRDLARRVSAELLRFGVVADDSAGQPLAETEGGAFLRLVARAVAEDFAPVPLLSLLKHPLAAGGMSRLDWIAMVRALEIWVLRGARPAPGLAGLRAAAQASLAGEARAERWAQVQPLLAALDRCFAGFDRLPHAPEREPAELLAAQMATAEALAATDDREGGLRLYAGEEGEPLALHLAALEPAMAALPPIAPSAWPSLFDAALEGPLAPAIRATRGRGAHPRVAILGLLESRLQRFDRVVLGALEEGLWPAGTDPGPWLSRPMRRDFGLPEVEARIGRQAADFLLLAASCTEVVLSRAQKRGGAPTQPARWLTRLATFLGGQGQPLPEHPAAAWAEALDRQPPPGAFARPAPNPPLHARPDTISVTEVEALIADPYAFYARRILKLRRLDDLDADLGAQDFGIAVHAAMADWARRLHGQPWPGAEVARALFAEAAARALEPYAVRPALLAFWQARLARIGDWVVAIEDAAPPSLRLPELAGRLSLGLSPPVTLTGRADRVDLLPGGGLALLDFKTGALPGNKAVAEGHKPQLPLEAAMIGADALPGVPPGHLVTRLEYRRLSGGGEPGELRVPADTVEKIEAMAAHALDQTRELARRFLRARTAFLARPHPKRSAMGSDYAHLSREDEWGEGDDEA